jgi:hypothetical protein
MADDDKKLRNFLDADNVSDFKKVKAFLEKNPMASVMDVMKDTGVTSTRIMGFVNAGALKIKNTAKK